MLPPRTRRLLFLLVLAVAVGGFALWRQHEYELQAQRYRRVSLPGHRNALRLDGPPRTLELPLAPMVELDRLSRAQVLALRARAVARRPDLLATPYQPTDEVFGQVQDGKPWWGIEGIYLRGRGPRSSDGPSEESRFIVNPFLLVGVIETVSYGGGAMAGAPPGTERPPRCEGLTYRLGGQPVVSARYEIRAFLAFASERVAEEYQRQVTLVTYNARDLGFTHALVDAGASRGIRVLGPVGGPFPLRQFLHTGPSCGQPGGCNNMSPHAPELEVELAELPARVVMRLWRERPGNAASPADVTVELELR